MKTLPAIYPDMMPVEAAAVGFSAFRCDSCGTHITKSQELDSPIWHEVPLVVCGICGGEEQPGSVTVIPSSAHLLQNDAVKETIWYHTTYVNDWFEKVSTGQGMEKEAGDFLYIHVGCEEASREIALHKHFSVYGNDPDVFLYQVKLKDNAMLSSHVVNDNKTWRDFSSVTDKTQAIMGGDAVRYVNRWESPGSISLLVDARQLEFVSVSRLDNPLRDNEKQPVCA